MMRQKKAGRLGPENHPLVRPDDMEAEAVHRLLVIAKEAKAPVMVVHLTNRKALEEVRQGRKAGQTVYERPAHSICCLKTVLFQNRIFRGLFMYVHLQSAKKKIRSACGRLLQRKNFRP